MRRAGTLRTRLLVAFVLLVLLPAAGVGTGSIVLGIRHGMQQAFDKLESVAAVKETEVRGWLQNLRTDLLGLADEEVYRRAARLLSESRADGAVADEAAVLDRFKHVVDLTGRYEELFLLSRQGVVRLSTDPVSVGELRGLQPYFREGLKRPGVHVRTVSYSSTSERLNTIIVVHPVRDARGEVVGVMCGQAKLGALNVVMGERTGLGESGETYLVGSNHVLMSASPFVGFTPGMTAIHTDGVQAALSNQQKGRAFYPGYRGEPVIGVYRWLPELNAVLLAEQGRDEAFRPIYTTLALNAIVAAVAVLLAGIAALLFARSIAIPLAALARTATRVAQGDLDMSAEVAAPAEIGSVARAFNAMTGRLKRRIEAERLIAAISRRFVGLGARDMDEAIERALAEIGAAMGAERGWVFLLSSDGKTVSATHGWCAEGVDPGNLPSERLPVHSFPWFFATLERLEIVHVPSVADLPVEASAEKRAWDAQGIRSLVSVPMTYGSKLRGHVELSSVTHARAWSAEDVQLLRLMGEIICTSLQRTWFESTLAAERERLAVTLRSIGDGVITTDAGGRITMMNPVAEELTGWTHEEAVGRSLSEVFVIVNEVSGEPCASPVAKVLERGLVVGLANHTALIARDGARRIIADSGAPIRDAEGRIIGVILVFRDDTEKRLFERESARAEKLESIGILAGGIAHDFNNILTAITGNLSLARLDAEEIAPTLLPSLETAEKAAKMAVGLTQQLLTFAKGGAPIKKTTSLAELVLDALSFALRGSNVRSETAIASDLWPVEVDRGQIAQVLNNLAINAKQAMPHGGVLAMAVENQVLADGNPQGLAAGGYVKITMRDTGAGIAHDHLAKIFDPYFTTKPSGSGLGLTTSYAIVKKHHGTIVAQSKPGIGATFEVYLPASDQDPAEKPRAAPHVARGEGSILVMDDEEAVRNTMRRILVHLGYDVELSCEGSEAVRRYDDAFRSGRPFDLVIMDLTIPGGMGGKEAVQALKRIDPDVRAIVSSGYSDDPVMSSFREHGFAGVVVKPYDVAGLAEQVRKALQDR